MAASLEFPDARQSWREDVWTEAELVWPGPKQAISLRVDEDILEWFRKRGPRYQSRMNAVLRSYVSVMRRKRWKGRAPATA